MKQIYIRDELAEEILALETEHKDLIAAGKDKEDLYRRQRLLTLELYYDTTAQLEMDNARKA